MTEITNILLLLLFSSMLLTAAEANNVNDTCQPSADTIIFTLYTRQTGQLGHVITLNDRHSIMNSNWDANKPTVLIIHGAFSDGSGPFTVIRDGFLSASDSNVLTINYGKIALNTNIPAILAATPIVIDRVTDFLNFMRADANLTNSNLKMVGHSLGAQIAGLSARALSKYGLVSEIVALDPALPGFYDKGPDGRVDKSQAKNVQAIHTNGGGFGLPYSVGTSDFYANGGHHQPGCLDISKDVFCSHERSFKYFGESLTNPKGFLGRSDSDNAAAYMGGVTLDPNAKGDYHFETNATPPYATSD